MSGEGPDLEGGIVSEGGGAETGAGVADLPRPPSEAFLSAREPPAGATVNVENHLEVEALQKLILEYYPVRALDIIGQLNTSPHHYVTLKLLKDDEAKFKEYVSKNVLRQISQTDIANQSRNCPICFEDFSRGRHRPVLCSAEVPCGNTICETCFRHLIAGPGNLNKCPMCRLPLKKKIVHNIALETFFKPSAVILGRRQTSRFSRLSSDSNQAGRNGNTGTAEQAQGAGTQPAVATPVLTPEDDLMPAHLQPQRVPPSRLRPCGVIYLWLWTAAQILPLVFGLLILQRVSNRTVQMARVVERSSYLFIDRRLCPQWIWDRVRQIMDGTDDGAWTVYAGFVMYALFNSLGIFLEFFFMVVEKNWFENMKASAWAVFAPPILSLASISLMAPAFAFQYDDMVMWDPFASTEDVVIEVDGLESDVVRVFPQNSEEDFCPTAVAAGIDSNFDAWVQYAQGMMITMLVAPAGLFFFWFVISDSSGRLFRSMSSDGRRRAMVLWWLFFGSPYYLACIAGMWVQTAWPGFALWSVITMTLHLVRPAFWRFVLMDNGGERRRIEAENQRRARELEVHRREIVQRARERLEANMRREAGGDQTTPAANTTAEAAADGDGESPRRRRSDPGLAARAGEGSEGDNDEFVTISEHEEPGDAGERGEEMDEPDRRRASQISNVIDLGDEENERLPPPPAGPTPRRTVSSNSTRMAMRGVGPTRIPNAVPSTPTFL
uniref:RING-type domain-containing protein n=1 Tax=Chromera velia CCMP2878 TaxID=1169474 RepID=A0A0G4HVX4_9ALVE|eukprot:Cvel_1424.t1-p1 / transcript=Cvel_1424.t1 / gene=Cvel_1424 / organism=Chromera_velia_CCMP2878 / gene_product=hypothetical protein / transcript_product=hypothetical protein / location=Cvel_scaffold49:156003-161107(-) / protein_length=722 / sequence_SO=supercontig / SO=protein_coding / is_pseudo=false